MNFNNFIVNKEPIVSVILPVYNGENYIQKAIESILNQSFSEFELIIVNDCSTDSTIEIIDFFSQKDSRIKILNNTSNKKLPASLNIGHKKASGNFITWTSHDNILHVNHLERLIKFIIDGNFDVIYSDFEIIDENELIVKVIKTCPCENLIFENCIGASFLYKKSVFYELNGYNENLFLIEDYDFWLRASLKFNFFKLNEILYKYRIHSENLKSKIENNDFEKNQYNRVVNEMIIEFAHSLHWHEKTIDFFLKYKIENKILVSEYLSNMKIINYDFDKLKGKYLDSKIIMETLIFKIRLEFLMNSKNHTINNIIKALLCKRELLFNKFYSKKKTINLIFNCFNKN